MHKLKENKQVVVTQFKWAGNLGFLRIKSHCNECDIVTASLKNIIDGELKDKNLVLEIKPWLNNIFFLLIKGAWHPPIILINKKLFFQFSHKKPMFDRNKLIKALSRSLQ